MEKLSKKNDNIPTSNIESDENDPFTSPNTKRKSQSQHQFELPTNSDNDFENLGRF